MSEYTTIQLTHEVKQKLDLVKEVKNLKTYNDILLYFLEQYGGAVTDDVIEIDRDETAFSLRFWRFDRPSRIITKDITFKELKKADVGTEFIANPEAEGNGFINSSARVVFKENDEVVLLVEEINKDKEGVEDILTSVMHVNLF